MGFEKYKVDIPEGISGDWKVERFTVNQKDVELQLIRTFSNGGRYVPAGEYTKLSHRNYVVMSDTPDEIRDHLQPIHRATGRCLVNGLGLGMVVSAMLNNEEVDHVTVVEKSEDVINLVAPHLLKKHSRFHLKIVHADAFEFSPKPKEMWDVVWHDIWNDLCADNLPDMKKLHRKYGRKCDWQGSWGRGICEAAERKYRKEERRWGRFASV